SYVEFNGARPGRRNLHSLPSGVGPFPFSRTRPATIYTIANTGAMLDIGQERSREKAALAAESRCASDSNWATPLHSHHRAHANTWTEEPSSTRLNTDSCRSSISSGRPPSSDSKSSKFRQLKERVSDSYNHPEGVAVA